MHAQMDKQKLLDLNRVEHDFLRRAVDTLTPEQQATLEIMPGWTAKDMLAHITMWEQRFIGWVEAVQQGERPDYPSTGFNAELIEQINTAAFQEHRSTPLPEVKAAFERSFFEMQRLLSRLTEAEVMQPGPFPFTGEHALWQFAASNAFEHYREHAEALRAWLAAREG